MPTSEVSIAKPLSGSESLEACIVALRTALAKDDRFSNHFAYPGFRAVIDFRFYPHQSYVPDVERTVEVQQGEDGIDGPMITVSVEMPIRSPNQVREEAGMAQPLLVTDGQGQSHEEWKKVSKKPPQMSVPHNKIKGV